MDDAPDLLPLVYADLRAAAAKLMSGERRDHTLQPTALVNEAYLRLAKAGFPACPGPREFFLAAAQAMRRILVEHARRRGAKKRGGGGDWSRAALAVVDLASDEDCARVLALDEAISRLSEEDERAAAVVKLRFYAGLDVDATAEALGVSRRTALRDWEFARARLLQDLRRDDGGG